jgi:hypothetical protein
MGDSKQVVSGLAQRMQELKNEQKRHIQDSKDERDSRCNYEASSKVLGS